MRVLIRCDASETLGIGHLMRCVALAERAQTSLFAMTAGAELAASRGFSSVTIGRDPAEFRALVESWRPDWVVIDVADGDAVIAACAGLPVSILRIDDAGLAASGDDGLILNPNVGMTGDDYPGRSPERLLLGPAYALLRKGFTDTKRQLNSPPRVFVTFGGSDPPNVTQRVIAALADVPDIGIDVIIGPANVNKAALIASAAAMRNVTAHIDPPNLAAIMANCDLAVTAASGTMWELMALGTPVIALAIVPGQSRNLAWLAENGVGRALGWHADVTGDAVAAAVRDCMNNPALRYDMAARGSALVDGRGADRVFDKMRLMVRSKA